MNDLKMNIKTQTMEQLTEQGQRQAMELLEKFKSEFASELERVVRNFYTDCLPYIESDAWLNYRTQIEQNLNWNYSDTKWKGMRQKIYQEHKDEIIKGLNQDNIREIERLKADLKELAKF